MLPQSLQHRGDSIHVPRPEVNLIRRRAQAPKRALARQKWRRKLRCDESRAHHEGELDCRICPRLGSQPSSQEAKLYITKHSKANGGNPRYPGTGIPNILKCWNMGKM